MPAARPNTMHPTSAGQLMATRALEPFTSTGLPGVPLTTSMMSPIPRLSRPTTTHSCGVKQATADWEAGMGAVDTDEA